MTQQAMTPETKITPHFTYRELTNSATGRRLGLENKPNEQELANIRKTAERLEKIRAWLGKKYGREVSIHVLSCFRSAAVNGAVGGSKTSAHRFGSAADIDAAGISNLQLARDIIQMRDAGEITFDQLIYEFPERGESGWVHFGCRHNSAERNQILTATKRGNGGKTQYLFGLHP